MQITISLKVLAALAEIADGASANKCADKICFRPGYNDVVATNGHVMVALTNMCAMVGNVVTTITACRAKAIVFEAKNMKSVKTHGTVTLFSSQEEYDDYINEQSRSPDCFPDAAFLFVPGYDYVSMDSINNCLNMGEREADTFVPSFNLKYQEKVAKLWCAVSGFKNKDDPRYDKVYYGRNNALYMTWEDLKKEFHAVIMGYRR